MSVSRAREALVGLVDLVLPLRCAGCDASGSAWCPECAAEFTWPRRLWRPLLREGPPTFTIGRYRGAARRAVLGYKEAGRRDLAAPFGEALAVGLRRIPSARGSCWLVPAPSRTLAARRRGGAHMVRVARHTASALRDAGWSIELADCLVLNPRVRDSVGLDPDERLRNLSGQVSPRRGRAPPAGTSVVLLDDVVTTGATVATSTQALGSMAIRVTAALSLTATAS